MKKYISLLLVLGVVLGAGVAPALAQQAPAKAEVTKVDDATKLKVVQHGDIILTRMATVLSQQVIVGTQLESRVARLQGRGANVTAAIAKVKDTSAAWNKARTNFEKIPAVFNEALTNSTKAEGLALIRDAIQSMRDEIRAVNRKLGETISVVAKLDADTVAQEAAAQQ